MVGCGYYRIIGDNLLHNYQETILTIGIACFVVKIVKQQLEVDDTLPQCSDALASFVFIESSDSFSSEDLTPLPSLTKLPKGIFQSDVSLSSKPSTLVGSIQFVLFCVCAMVLPRQTSNKLQTLHYDKILLQKVQFLLITFNGDILFDFAANISNCSEPFPNVRYG